MNTKKALTRVAVDSKKLKRAQKALNVKTEMEAVDEALDVILANFKVNKAHKKFVESGVVIDDVYDGVDQR